MLAKKMQTLRWPHPFAKWSPCHVIRAALGSISSRTDERDESERSRSSSCLPFSLLRGYGQDLSLRRAGCSCFPRDA